MPEGTGATRDEVNRAIAALTPPELLRLKHFAVWRMCGLGRAGYWCTWEDLLSEAKVSTVEGAANNGGGRRWNQNVNLVTHLVGAMRSISSHWKRDFDEQEVELESEIVTRSKERDWVSPLGYVVSNHASLESDLSTRVVLDRLLGLFPTDSAANRVVDGWKKDLTAAAIMQSYELTKSEYQRAVRQIRQCLIGWGWPKRRGCRDLGGRQSP